MKRPGWRYESVRHSLAARGVRTKSWSSGVSSNKRDNRMYIDKLKREGYGEKFFVDTVSGRVVAGFSEKKGLRSRVVDLDLVDKKKYMAKKGEYFVEKNSEELQEGAEYRRIRLSKPHIVIADTSVGTIIEDQNGRGLVTSGGSHSLPVDQDTDVAISKVKKSIEELESQDWTEGTREKLKNMYGLKLQALKELREQEGRK